jgi:N-carbamoyl-L-amino-acid hydrolase
VHIEQGPVLNELDLPLGIVTSINGSVRYVGEYIGMASHAGTTPMDRRRDAACAVAELALYIEQRAAQDGDSVATMGMLQVPNGSINVVPGRCSSAWTCARPPTPSATPCPPTSWPSPRHRRAPRPAVPAGRDHARRRRAQRPWQKRWEAAVDALGLPVFRMPSGAGHDAMKLHEIMPQAMLFVRGENAGISHNPLESTTADDMQLAVRAMQHLLDAVAANQRCCPH